MNAPLNIEDDVYHFVRTFIEAKGYAPSLREIAAALEVNSLESIHRYLNQLKAKHKVDWIPGKARTLRLME